MKDAIHLPNATNQEWSFISGFHAQYKEVEAIFSSHWHILLMDRVLKPALPPKPGFIYRRLPNYVDKIVKKVLDPPSKRPIFLG